MITDRTHKPASDLQVAGKRQLTAVELQQLAAVPAAVEWFANIDNPRTRRANQRDLEDFCSYVGLNDAEEFRVVTRAHVLACRAQLEQRGLAGATIRREEATQLQTGDLQARWGIKHLRPRQVRKAALAAPTPGCCSADPCLPT